MSDLLIALPVEDFIKDPSNVSNYELYRRQEKFNLSGKREGTCKYWYNCPYLGQPDDTAEVIIEYSDGVANGLFLYDDLAENRLKITYINGIRYGRYYASEAVDNGGSKCNTVEGKYKNGLKHGVFELHLCNKIYSEITEYYEGKELNKSYCMKCSDGNKKKYYTYKCGHKFHTTCLELTVNQAWNSPVNKCSDCVE